MRNMMERGWDSPYIQLALKRFETLAADLETTLTTFTWLAGDSYSLADADFTPYLQRMEDLGLEWLWEDRPALAAWYARVQSRPSFAAVVKDWFSADERAEAAAKARQIGPKFPELLEAA